MNQGLMHRMRARIRLGSAATKSVLSDPKRAMRLLGWSSPIETRGRAVAEFWSAIDAVPARDPTARVNPLREYFEANKVGAGIWKWMHYFDIYQDHLARFVNSGANVVEIGVYGGGSLSMWRSYFGRESQVYGIDIEPACRAHAEEGVSIFIGDQADRSFWSAFRGQVPTVDVLIDDGGHSPEQQMVTLEEMLPHLQPGGVFICEDIHGVNNAFTRFAVGLVDELNAWVESASPAHACAASPFQQAVHSIHFYPFMLVIEKHLFGPEHLVLAKRGTEWPAFAANREA